MKSCSTVDLEFPEDVALKETNDIVFTPNYPKPPEMKDRMIGCDKSLCGLLGD